MRLVQGIFIIAAVFGALAYSFNKKSVSAGELSSANEIRAAVMLQDDLLSTVVPQEKPSLNMEITRATVHGDILSVYVQYTACEDLEFDLVGMREFAESFPVQAQLQLHAEGEVDAACSVVRSQELQFEIHDLRKLFRNRYNMATGTILLQLNEFPTLVRYDF